MGRHDVRGAAHHGVPVLVCNLAVVGEAIDLVVLCPVPDLGDEELDLVGLLPTAGEDGAQRLGIGVGQSAPGDVTTVIGITPHVGQAAAADPEILELVVATEDRKSTRLNSSHSSAT